GRGTQRGPTGRGTPRDFVVARRDGARYERRLLIKAAVAKRSATAPSAMPMIPRARALSSFAAATIATLPEGGSLVEGVVAPTGSVSSRIGVGCSASGPP